MSSPYPPNSEPDPGSNPPAGGYPPPYGQPQYGQPQYGQPQYGQPQYGQPAQPQYGQSQPPQPQYGQPQYGQPQYGQPQYGQPQYGQPQYGQPQYPAPQYGQPADPTYPSQGAETTQFPAFGQQPQYPQQVYPANGPDLLSSQQPPEPKKRGVGPKIARYAVILVVAIVIGIVKVGLLDHTPSTPQATPPSGTSATSDTKGKPTGPFVDTPAAEYPEGNAGIVLPAATSIAGFTKTQVAADLQQVRKGLIASRLDPKMLVSHDPSTLVALIAGDGRSNITDDFTKKNFFAYATEIADGQTLTSDTVRVKGRVTFRASTRSDIRGLEVITNFVWVYPFSGELKDAGDHLVIVHDEVTWFFPRDDDVLKTSRGMWIDAANAYASNMDCDLLNQSLLGLGAPILGGTSDDPNAAFDPNSSLDIKSTC